MIFFSLYHSAPLPTLFSIESHDPVFHIVNIYRPKRPRTMCMHHDQLIRYLTRSIDIVTCT